MVDRASESFSKPPNGGGESPLPSLESFRRLPAADRSLDSTERLFGTVDSPQQKLLIRAILKSGDRQRLAELARHATPAQVKQLCDLADTLLSRTADDSESRCLADSLGQTLLAVMATGVDARSRQIAEEQFLKRAWPNAHTAEQRQEMVDCTKTNPNQANPMARLFYRGPLATLLDAPLQVVDAEAERKVRETPEVKAVAQVKDAVVGLAVGLPAGNTRGGSGMIIDAEKGYVLTAAHVLEKATWVSVKLSDKTTVFSGKVVFADEERDVAVVQVEPGDVKLKELPLGSSSDLLLNETVISIGTPFGYPSSVVTGRLSSTDDREITMPGGKKRNLLQFDANINAGNSGGPLILLTGRVPAMVVAVRDEARGISFALRSEGIVDVLREQLSSEKIARVRHGLVVKGKPILKGRFLDHQDLVVEDIAKDSPLAKVLNKGDIIIKVGDRAFENANSFDFERSLYRYKPGEKVDLTILRDGKEMTVVFDIPEAKKDKK
jgi:S1-C subfamily serine protease